MVDEIPRVNWAAFSLEQKYAMVHNGPGSEAVVPAARGLGALAPRFAESSEAIQSALAGVGLTWEGRAATAFTEQMRQTADWARRGGAAGQAGADQIHSYGGSFDTTRNKVPAPVEIGQNSFWGRRADEFGTALRDTFGGAFGVQSDYTKRLAAYRDADEVANQALGEHENLTRQAVASFPEAEAARTGPTGGPSPVGGAGTSGRGPASGNAAGAGTGSAAGAGGPRTGGPGAAPGPGTAGPPGRGGGPTGSAPGQGWTPVTPSAADPGSPAASHGDRPAAVQPGSAQPGRQPEVGLPTGSPGVDGPTTSRSGWPRSDGSPVGAGRGTAGQPPRWWDSSTGGAARPGGGSRVPSGPSGGPLGRTLWPRGGTALPEPIAPGSGGSAAEVRSGWGTPRGLAGATGAGGQPGVPPLLGGAGMAGHQREHRNTVYISSDEPFAVDDCDDVVPPVLGLPDAPTS
jgi:uncharacterized protein YukE